MNYVRKYLKDHNDHETRKLRQTRTDINETPSSDLRYTNLTEGSLAYYYMAKRCRVWHSDMDTHRRELSNMKVRIIRIPKNSDCSKNVLVEILEDNRSDRVGEAGKKKWFDGSCMILIDADETDPSLVIKKCKSIHFLFLYNKNIILIYYYLLFRLERSSSKTGD